MRVLFPLLCSLLLSGCLGSGYEKRPASDLVRSQRTSRDGALEVNELSGVGVAHDRRYNALFAAVDEVTQDAILGEVRKKLPLLPSVRLENVIWHELLPSLKQVYRTVVRLPHDRVSARNLERSLRYLESLGRDYHVILITHGIPNHLIASKGNPPISYKDIQRLKGRLKHLDAVFMQACFGTSLSKDWLEAGANHVISFDGFTLNLFYFHTFFLRMAQIAPMAYDAREAYLASQGRYLYDIESNLKAWLLMRLGGVDLDEHREMLTMEPRMVSKVSATPLGRFDLSGVEKWD